MKVIQPSMRSLPTLNKQEPSFAVMYVSGLQSTTNSGYNVKVGRFVDIAEWYASSNQWSWQTLLLCLGNRTSLGLYVGLGARELAVMVCAGTLFTRDASCSMFRQTEGAPSLVGSSGGHGRWCRGERWLPTRATTAYGKRMSNHSSLV